MGIFIFIAGWPRGLVVKLFISKHFEYVQVNYGILIFIAGWPRGGGSKWGSIYVVFFIHKYLLVS